MFIDKTHLLWNDMMPKNQEQLKDSLQRFEESIMKEKYNPQEITSFN